MKTSAWKKLLAAAMVIATLFMMAGCTAPVPFDEVVAAMYAVGKALPAALRETALGGIAAAPSARGACEGCAGCG